jgi:hypothetical protein
MFRFLTNRITILVLLALLMLMTSFSPSYEINNNVNGFEDEDAPDNITSNHGHIDEHKDIEEDEEDQKSPFSGQGLYHAAIELSAPDFLPAGEPLYINVTLSDYEEGLACLLTLYINDEPVKEDLIVTGIEIPRFNHNIKYSRIMEESIDIKVSIQHTTLLNETHTLEAEQTIIIENYDISHWKEVETPRVLSMVTSRYNGNRTLEWALENDYDVFEKELYINAKGYTSETEYLIWVNRCFQRANVFKGTGRAGEWELHEAFIISTGIWINSTPRGVTTIPSRTSAGWAFSELGYRVEPVVRFFPESSSAQGSSYAFHSRPLDLRTREVVDSRIGFPASSGCIRMYCEDAWWIYNNVPDHSTVVVY